DSDAHTNAGGQAEGQSEPAPARAEVPSSPDMQLNGEAQAKNITSIADAIRGDGQTLLGAGLQTEPPKGAEEPAPPPTGGGLDELPRIWQNDPPEPDRTEAFTFDPSATEVIPAAESSGSLIVDFESEGSIEVAVEVEPVVPPTEPSVPEMTAAS